MYFVCSILLGLATPGLSRFLDTTAPKTALATATSDPHPDIVPRVTDAPLEKRAKSVSPNICGWYADQPFDQGVSDDKDPSRTCFWNTDEHLVGTEYPLPTACLEHHTAGDDTTLKCADDYPYCATFIYGQDYSSFRCWSDSDVTWTMEATWSGMVTPIAFPIYSGSKGVSTGTQYPSGYKRPTTTSDEESSTSSRSSSDSSESSTSTESTDTSSASHSSSTSTDSTETSSTSHSSSDSSTSSSSSSDTPLPSSQSSSSSSSESSTSTDSPGTTSSPKSESAVTESSSPNRGSSDSSPTPIGAIVGGVIGGLAVVGIVACVIVFLVMRRRREHKKNHPPSPEPEEPLVVPQLSKSSGEDDKFKPLEELHSYYLQELEPQDGYPHAGSLPPYQELWAGTDSTQRTVHVREMGGRQLYEAPGGETAFPRPHGPYAGSGRPIYEAP